MRGKKRRGTSGAMRTSSLIAVLAVAGLAGYGHPVSGKKASLAVEIVTQDGVPVESESAVRLEDEAHRDYSSFIRGLRASDLPVGSYRLTVEGIASPRDPGARWAMRRNDRDYRGSGRFVTFQFPHPPP